MKSFSELQFNPIKIICGLLLVITLPVMAMDLQQAMSNLGSAKSQGSVGEQPDGYLGSVDGKGDSQEIVKLINDARRAQYQKLAQENGISLTDVEKVAGQKAIEKTQSGQYVFINNKWVKKL